MRKNKINFVLVFSLICFLSLKISKVFSNQNIESENSASNENHENIKHDDKLNLSQDNIHNNSGHHTSLANLSIVPQIVLSFLFILLVGQIITYKKHSHHSSTDHENNHSDHNNNHSGH